MKILLWCDIDKLGKRGEIVSVRDGYARNYLFPRRYASEPTPSMYKEFEVEKRRQAKKDAVLISDAGVVAEKLKDVSSVSVEVNTNEEGNLYGAVTPTMIADGLLALGIKIEARAVEIAEPIKQVGTFEVTIKLHRDVQPKVKVWVLSTQKVTPPGEEPAAVSAEESEQKEETPPTEGE